MHCPRCGFKMSGVTKEMAKSIRSSYPRAFLPWTPEEDKKLENMSKIASLAQIGEALGRQPNAIKRRMELLGIKYEALSATSSDPIASDPTVWAEKEASDIKKIKKEPK